jgi:hypothetical protein
MIKTVMLKLMTVKAAAAVALTVAGGVAVAATTGTLPTTLTGSEHGTSGMSAASAHHAGRPSARPSASEEGKDHEGKHNGKQNGKQNDDQNQNGNGNGNQNDDQNGNGPTGANGSPSPSLTGLCHAVGAGNKDDHGKALENPAFTALITAAGGKDKVDVFCATLLASAAANDHPSDHGTGGTGKPSAAAHP